VDLEFENNLVQGLKFKVDTLNVTIASVLTLSAKDFELDTSATGTEFVVQFGALAASVKIGSLEIGGEARNFGITADGDFQVLPSKEFAVVLNIGGTTGSGLGGRFGCRFRSIPSD
jgi:hypothetical protein